MAPSNRVEVVLVQLKNCLVNLPSSLVSVLSNANTPAQNVVVELQYRSQTLSSGAISSGNAAGFQRSAYVGWTGMPSRARHPSMAASERSRPGSREQDLQAVEIDATFAKVIGLTEGQRVGILLHLDPPVAHTVNIEPLTPDDWETIELHATFLELNLLSQIRALPNPSYVSKASGQAEHSHPLTLHLSPTSTANILITSLVPAIPSSSPFAKIAPDAEVIVAPKVRPRSSRSRGDSQSIASRRSGKSRVSARAAGQSRGLRAPGAIYMRGLDRGLGQQWFADDEMNANNDGLKIWLSSEVVQSSFLKGLGVAFVSIVKPAGLRAQLEQNEMQKLKEEESSPAGMPASKIVARVLIWTNPPDDQHVALSTALCEALGLSGLLGQVIRIDPPSAPLPTFSLKTFKIFPFLSDSALPKSGLKFGGDTKLSRQALGERLRSIYGGDESLLAGPVTDGMILPPSVRSGSALDFDGGIIRFDSPSKEDGSRRSVPWVIGEEQKREFEVQPEIPRRVPLTTIFPSFANGRPSDCPDLVSVTPVVKKCLSNLSLCSSILLTGNVGSGKTSMAHLLCHRLREEYLFNTTYFSCRKLVTDEIRVSSIKDTLTKLFMSASWCARLGGQSVVVLDDLDKICPVETELQVGNDNGRSKQITEILCTIVRHYCSPQSGVTLLATAQSKDALHNVIIGGHIVGEIVSLKAPNKEARHSILKRLTDDISTFKAVTNGVNAHSRNLSDAGSMEDSWMDPSNSSTRPGSSSSSSPTDGFQISPSLDILDIAGKTDGYMPADLVLLFSRARNECLIRTLSSTDSPATTLTLLHMDFTRALQNFTPSSLRNVPLTHSTTTFASIGGLLSTRTTLLETLAYPTKYAPIFSTSPIRPRSNLLLYGYPGCGKTLLASAVAGECNLNFISVKGPEILNKYIGASEKAVRDLFERAQAARPCVLFFDEFDSIAPKRGHDSTGVTDRVVNQMLTQMDGAEGLGEGVYILAATSRPDLIDPALLRPGRLDRSLLCDMPNLDDRTDILRAVSEKLHLKPDVQKRLRNIAVKTEGFSGADLQALMYNAHLEAIHDLLGDDGSGKKKKKPDSMANGTKAISNHGKTASASHKNAAETAGGKHDFIQFLYSPTADASLLESRAAVLAKLDALKHTRKREKELLRHGNSIQRPTASSLLHQQLSSTAAATATEAGKNSGSGSGTEVVINWTHVERSLASTRSSISAAERRRLAAIYNEFVVGRNGEMPSGDGGREVGGRSTLM